MERTYVEGAKRLRIRTVAGVEFWVEGKSVYYIDYEEEGRIYYCNGSSYPDNIVLFVE